MATHSRSALARGIQRAIGQPKTQKFAKLLQTSDYQTFPVAAEVFLVPPRKTTKKHSYIIRNMARTYHKPIALWAVGYKQYGSYIYSFSTNKFISLRYSYYAKCHR